MTQPIIDYSQFESIDIRVGTVLQADPFPQARKPAYKLLIDLGPDIGIKKSSAQITKLYTAQQLVGTQVICVCNFAHKQIGPFISEVLTTRFADDRGRVVLSRPDKPVPNGSRLF